MIKLVETSSYSYAKDDSRDNQDSILSPKNLNDGFVFAVADGVGSYKGGGEASMLAIEYLDNLKSKDEILESNNEIFENIRNKIIKLSEKNNQYQQAATTLTFAFINDKGLTIGHIGDCRLYIKDNNKLLQVTKDHTQLQKLIDEKLFSKKFLQDKKAKNILTTAIAPNIEMKFDHIFIPINELPLDNGLLSIYIMSDGSHKLWDKRPRFSSNTMNNLARLVSSLKKRIERFMPIDDYSLVGLTVKFPIASSLDGA